MTNKNDNKAPDTFALIKRVLGSDIEDSMKLVLTHLLITSGTRKDGEPYTHSSPSICKATGKPDRTVRYLVSKLKKPGILKRYGTRLTPNGKREYDIFTFEYPCFVEWLSAAMVAAVKPNEYAVRNDVEDVSAAIDCGNGCRIEDNNIKAVAVPVQKTGQFEPDTLKDESDCDSDKSSVGSRSAEGSLLNFDDFFKDESSSVASMSASSGIEYGEKVLDLHSNVASGDMGSDQARNGIGVAPTPSRLATGDCEDIIKQPSASVSAQVKVPLRYVADEKAIIELRLPWNIPSNHCAKRQDWIVKELNKEGAFFTKDEPTGSRLEGHWCCAYSPEEKQILITCENLEHVKTAHVQKVCAHFKPQKWNVYVWTEKDGKVFKMVKAK